MARRVRWTERGLGDVDQMAAYIARDSRRYAAIMVRRVRELARSLRTWGDRGAEVPELEDSSIREVLLGSYRLIYRLEEKEVTILGLIHGARDLAALWKRERR